MKINDLLNGKKDSYIIAEIAQNHDGSLGQAHAYIDAVARTGADAIKFQTHIADAESTIHEPFRVKFSYEDETRFDYWKRMEFSKAQWKELYDHAVSLGLDFLSSPFSVNALQMLDEIGVPAWKFGSGEIYNDVLLSEAIQTGKPIIISNGLINEEKLDCVTRKIRDAGNDLIIMECTTAYPSTFDEIRLNNITYLKEKYACPVGISDHSATVFPALAAVTLGASLVEVHVTMSREMFGPDVKASVATDELKTIVDGVNAINTMKKVTDSMDDVVNRKQDLKNMFSKSIYANCNIAEGELITEENIGIKKPYCNDGIEVADFYSLIGKRARFNIDKNCVITKESLE